ncbi:uncharacterized protein LOC119738868 [Patiria miniata]|uniref:EGF-like domain-containing protein n=1 Tax=Patiria miniata TaxID=46514 RepID=A0A914B1A4_PATMI|nr:uncharacterized protein LOC119738868 [Patiria miniata]
MKSLVISAIAFALCIALVQGNERDALSTRSSSCLRLMIVSNNCNNHGYCSLGNNGWACRCENGWGGRDCVRELKPARTRQLAADEGGLKERRDKKVLALALLRKLMKQ